MLILGCPFSINPTRSHTARVAWDLFFQPIQLDGLPAEPGVKPGGHLLEPLGIGLARSCPEAARGVVGHRLLPLGDLHWASVESLGDFLDGFHALDRLKRQAGIESGIASSVSVFHWVRVPFGLQAAPTHLTHSLAPSPNPGIRLGRG